MIVGTLLVVSVLVNIALLMYVARLNTELDDYEMVVEKQDQAIRNYLAKDYVQETRYIKQDYDAQG